MKTFQISPAFKYYVEGDVPIFFYGAAPTGVSGAASASITLFFQTGVAF